MEERRIETLEAGQTSAGYEFAGGVDIPTESILHRPKASLGGTIASVGAVPDPVDDGVLVARIVAAWQNAKAMPPDDDDSVWRTCIAELQANDLEVLTRGDIAEVAALLRDPQHTQLFTGFDDLVAYSPWTPHFRDPQFQELMRQWIYDCLLRVAEAFGTIVVEAVEAGRACQPVDVEDLLSGLDRAVGFTIPFPNIFPGEVGLLTARGVVGFRAVQSFYQGWRIAQLVGDPAGKRVVEIGGGLGRTAYYASLFGIEHYTIVDLPVANVCQAYFIGRTLGEERIGLFGEERTGGIAIAPPASFLGGDHAYDLAVNVDSLTEMSSATADDYWQRLRRSIPRLLSINHEGNRFTVRSLIVATDGVTATRVPYWLRRGYVEEVVEFRRPILPVLEAPPPRPGPFARFARYLRR